MPVGDWQFELDGMIFGRGTPWKVLAWDTTSAEVRTQDSSRPRRDGIYFGRDRKAGATWTFDVVANRLLDEAEALTLLGPLSMAWSGDDVRERPNAVVPLRYSIGGRARRVYGRPRRFSPVWDTMVVGRLPVVMDFQCRDHLFYDDVERTLVLDQVPVGSTGLTEPLSEPLSTQPFGSRPGVVNNVGDAPTPLVVRFDGPSTDPSLSLTGGDAIELRISLATSDSVTVDTDAGTVLLNGTGNVSGKLTRASRFFRLPPGNQELRYAALDPTATSKAAVTYRPAYTSL
jgi:hypothetical protein